MSVIGFEFGAITEATSVVPPPYTSGLGASGTVRPGREPRTGQRSVGICDPAGAGTGIIILRVPAVASAHIGVRQVRQLAASQDFADTWPDRHWRKTSIAREQIWRNVLYMKFARH